MNPFRTLRRFHLVSAERLRRRRRLLAREHLRDDFVRRRKVALHEQRLDGQHVGNRVEAVRRLITRKIRRVEIHREQIADRVPVFLAVQTAQRHASRIFLPRLAARELPVNPLHERLALLFRRLRLGLRWHLARFEQLRDLLPRLALAGRETFFRVWAEIEVPFLLLGPVAGEAVLFPKLSQLPHDRLRFPARDAGNAHGGGEEAAEINSAQGHDAEFYAAKMAQLGKMWNRRLVGLDNGIAGHFSGDAGRAVRRLIFRACAGPTNRRPHIFRRASP